MTGKFLYFAYGSNLLAQRIHINNPSAVRAGIAKLNVRYTQLFKYISIKISFLELQTRLCNIF